MAATPSVARKPECRSRRELILACGACLLACAALPATAKNARPAERGWIEQSSALVKAAKGHANVADFRHDVRRHHERLREIVRANRNPPPAVLRLHRTMILTFALLNAASECHSGGRLACPEDLMRNLEEQLRVGFEQLRVLEQGLA